MFDTDPVVDVVMPRVFSRRCITRACVILSNGYSRASIMFGGRVVGSLPSIGHTMLGDLKIGFVESVVPKTTGPFDIIGTIVVPPFDDFGSTTLVADVVYDVDGPGIATLASVATVAGCCWFDCDSKLVSSPRPLLPPEHDAWLLSASTSKMKR